MTTLSRAATGRTSCSAATATIASPEVTATTVCSRGTRRRLRRRRRRETTRSRCATAAPTAPGAAPAETAVRAETLDALDVACERVDYGPPGARRQARRDEPAAGAGFLSPAQTWARVDRRILAERALPGPPLSRTRDRGLRGPATQLRRAPARAGRGRRAGPRRHVGRRVTACALGRASPKPSALPVPLGRLERRLQPRPPVPLQALPRLRAPPAPVVGAHSCSSTAPSSHGRVFQVR